MSSPLHDLHTALGAQFVDTPSAPGAEDAQAMPICYTDRDSEVNAVRTGAGVVDLTHIRPMILTSPDAQRWCNGMFTNNIRKLQPGQGNRSAICDDRGRVQGLIDLYRTDDESFLATLDGVSTDWFAERYKMLLFLDDIEVDVAEDGPWLLSVQGPQTDALLEQLGLPIPAESHQHAVEGSVRVTRKDRTGLGGVDLFCADAETARQTWRQLLDAGATPLGHDALDALRILAGRARWPEDGTDKSMVHELAINEEVCAFDKGCYVGQEVINRIDVKGLIQKRLTLLRIDGSATCGDTLVLDDRTVGTLSSITSVEQTTYGLAVLRKQAWPEGTVVALQSDDGPSASATVIASLW